jgi:hypothetical protein
MILGNKNFVLFCSNNQWNFIKIEKEQRKGFCGLERKNDSNILMFKNQLVKNKSN